MCEQTKLCSKCRENLPTFCFSTDKYKKSGIRSQCKDCCNIGKRSKYWDNPQEQRDRVNSYNARPEVLLTRSTKYTPSVVAKRCSKCKETLSASCFSLDKSDKSGLYRRCKDCNSRLTKERYRKNPKQFTDRNEAYRLLPETRAQINRRVKERKETCVTYRLRHNLRSRFYHALDKGYKSGSAVDDLGCSIEEFKTYMESKFSYAMSWNNHGNKKDMWSIDHIMPMSAFNLEDRQHVVLACHYLNLQPLWHIENIKKSNKIPVISIEHWSSHNDCKSVAA